MKKVSIKHFKEKIIISVVIVLYAICTNLAGVSCIIFKVTGYPCLGCGMTHALFEVLKFQIKNAFSYHYMFWSVPILYLSFLLDGKLVNNKISNISLHILILLGFIINWLQKVII